MKTIRTLAGLIVISLIFLFTGCDSGNKAVDEVTGNRAVKQYHKAAQDLGKIADQQDQRLDGVAEEKDR